MKRYYFHGDQNETQKDKYYCAFCDSFEDEFHILQKYSKEENLKRYERSCDYLEKEHQEGNSKEYFRNPGAYNILL